MRQRMMGILKRKFSELDEDSCCSSSSSPSCCGWDSDKQNQDLPPHSPPAPAALPLRSILKRPKLPAAQNSVCFLQVTVYSFPRCQGFTGVPSRGGATLGMTRRHCEVQTFTIAEYALEQRHRRREQLRERWRQDNFLEMKKKLISSGTINETEAETLTIDQVPFEETNININSVELEGGGFLQPYSSKQRQAILLAAGVRRIDKEEKRQLHALRLSRETCGCDCQGFCEPESCACSLAGIKCQVDRFNFPCGCSQDGCGNTQGRVEFDSRRVRTHHFHTIMRLELERRPKHETHLSKDQSAVLMVSSKVHLSQNGQELSGTCDVSCQEEDDNGQNIPALRSFSLLPDQRMLEENSCSSDMTDSSCSSSDAVNLSGLSTPSENDQRSSHDLTLCDNYTSNTPIRNTNELMVKNSYTCTDFVGPLCSNDHSFMDILSLSPQPKCVDKNSLEDFPNTPSPSGDYYMDLSLSSDSDLEFFDSDYTSGLPHCSFKSQPLSDSLDHLQLFSCDLLPQDESSTYLLESLIGLTD